MKFKSVSCFIYLLCLINLGACSEETEETIVKKTSDLPKDGTSVTNSDVKKGTLTDDNDSRSEDLVVQKRTEQKDDKELISNLMEVGQQASSTLKETHDKTSSNTEIKNNNVKRKKFTMTKETGDEIDKEAIHEDIDGGEKVTVETCKDKNKGDGAEIADKTTFKEKKIENDEKTEVQCQAQLENLINKSTEDNTSINDLKAESNSSDVKESDHHSSEDSSTDSKEHDGEVQKRMCGGPFGYPPPGGHMLYPYYPPQMYPPVMAPPMVVPPPIMPPQVVLPGQVIRPIGVPPGIGVGVGMGVPNVGFPQVIPQAVVPF